MGLDHYQHRADAGAAESIGADLTMWVNPSFLRASPNHFETDSE
jgi:hypothetical protein